MKQPGWCIFFSGLVWLLFASSGQATQRLETPTRIVTLAPSLAELASDLLGDSAANRIVGVSEYTDYPTSLKGKPSIGPFHWVQIEKVMTLKPDLVLATVDGNPKDQVLRLQELGARVVVVDTHTLDDVFASVTKLGEVLGVPERAQVLRRRMEDTLSQVRARTAAQKRKFRVVTQLGDDPLVVAGPTSFLHPILEALGGENVYADLKGSAYPKPARLDVVKRDPELILILGMGSEKFSKKAKAEWERFPKLSAVRFNRLLLFTHDGLMRPSSRLIDGILELEKALQSLLRGSP